MMSTANKSRPFFYFLLFFSLIFSFYQPLMAQISSVSSSVGQMMGDQEQLDHGQALYERRCIGCHGEKGDGNGPSSIFLNPRPRDFTKGVFKFTDTAVGMPPSDLRLMKTIQQGIKHSSMPSYVELDTREFPGLINYIRNFNQNPELKKLSLEQIRPITFEPLPMEEFLDGKKFYELAKKGKKLFQEACVVCHGTLGDGQGVGGQELVNDFNQPIKPANLRLPSIKRGKSVQDIYETLIFGVNSTPMVSFKDSYPASDLFALTAFVFYLRGEEAGLYTADQKLTPLADL